MDVPFLRLGRACCVYETFFLNHEFDEELEKALRSGFTDFVANHHFDETANNKVVSHSFLLSFNGRYINAGGLLATGKFVSHVTGFATLFGVAVTKGDIGIGISILSVPIFFLLSAFIAGLLIERPIHYGRKRPLRLGHGLKCVLLGDRYGHCEVLHVGVFEKVMDVKEGFLLMVLVRTFKR
jgi:hypothetical protein